MNFPRYSASPPSHILCDTRRLLHLTPSVSDVPVFARHPDLPERVLRELPRAALQHKLFVVQHCGCSIMNGEDVRRRAPVLAV